MRRLRWRIGGYRGEQERGMEDEREAYKMEAAKKGMRSVSCCFEVGGETDLRVPVHAHARALDERVTPLEVGVVLLVAFVGYLGGGLRLTLSRFSFHSLTSHSSSPTSYPSYPSSPYPSHPYQVVCTPCSSRATQMLNAEALAGAVERAIYV